MDYNEITEELSLNQDQANSLYIALSKLHALQSTELDALKDEAALKNFDITQEEKESTIILIQAINADIRDILPELKDVMGMLETRIQGENKSPNGIIY